MIERTRIAMINITKNYIQSEKNLKYYALNLKKSNNDKKELEMIIERSPIFIFKMRMDINWTMLFMSSNISQLGYKFEDFKNGKKSYFDLIHMDDVTKLYKKISSHFYLNDSYFIDEYRIITNNGDIRWVESRIYFNKKDEKYTDLQGISLDITERKIVEQKLRISEELQKKEIHHRIKNNLQVISTLLYLESSKFKNKNVKKAFENSQSRIKSMALIHEELYRSDNIDSQKINFKRYIFKLTDSLFQTYKITTKKINLKLEIDEIYLLMDIAIPLGTIINELVTNSLKYAFINEDMNNETIWIKLKKNKGTIYLIIGDNGISMKKIPNTDNISSLGLQLVYALVDQINGSIKAKIRNKLEYKIIFQIDK